MIYKKFYRTAMQFGEKIKLFSGKLMFCDGREPVCYIFSYFKNSYKAKSSKPNRLWQAGLS